MKKCKCNKEMFVGSNYDGENGSIRAIWQCNNCNTMIETNINKDGIERYMVQDGENTVFMLNLEMLSEINRERSDSWSNYNIRDWMEGWWHWVESEDIHLEIMTCENI